MDIVEVGLSVTGVSVGFVEGLNIPPFLIPPFVDRSLGIPPANIPPKPGAAPLPPLPMPGGGACGGAELWTSALPALFARARVFGADGLNAAPTPGTGGAAPTR